MIANELTFYSILVDLARDLKLTFPLRVDQEKRLDELMNMYLDMLIESGKFPDEMIYIERARCLQGLPVPVTFIDQC